MRRILFQWRGLQVYSYPAMLFLGLVFGVIGGTYASALHGQDPSRIFMAELLLLLPALVGARLLFVAAHWKDYRHRPELILSRANGGAHLYGGLIFAFLCSLPLLTVLKICIGAFWDTAAVTILIGMIFTRFGCLLNGCCAGRPSEDFFTLKLTNIKGVTCRRRPTQLLEALLGAALLVTSLWLWNRIPFDGALFLFNIAGYGFGRYWLELTRENSDRIGATRLNQAISIAMVAVSAGAYLYVSVFGLGLAAVHQSNMTHPANSPYLLFAPIAVLAVLALFHSVGCASFVGIDDVSYATGGYPATVIGETNTKPNLPANIVTIAYWRLQEPSSPPTTTAIDSITGAHNGTYKTVTLPPLPDPNLDPDHSPTTAQPALLKFGAAGLLGNPPAAPTTNTSIEVSGGFVEVPSTSAFSIPSFTLEALVDPLWDFTKLGKYYCVMEYTTILANKKLGIAIYAGPENVSHLNTPYRWQVWVSHTSGATSKFEQVMQVTGPARPVPLVEPNKTNYIAVTCDSSTIQLYSTFEGKLSGIDLTQLKKETVQALDEPTAYVQNPGPTEFRIGMGRDSFGPFGTAAPLERYPFNGRIQEAAIYKEVLTWERITSHFAAALKEI